MPEPTRRLKDPIVDENGDLVVHSVTTPESFNVRGAALIGSNKVIPVIFIPGTMGTNLRVRSDVSLPPGYPLKPGDPAWRPPNDDLGAVAYSKKWSKRDPSERQLILNPNYLEVDDTGELDIDSCNLEHSVMKERGWGEIFNGSYGTLLYELQSHLETTFRFDALNKRHVRNCWKEVMQAMEGDSLQRWGVRSVEPLTESELEKYAQYQYQIYACGYNWLQSCGESAKRLEKKVNDIIKWWKDRKHKCEKVILVTHSMGGLVGRACAKRIPDKIAGVIHGVMPALGAPLAYRRLACGTERDNPTNDASKVLDKLASLLTLGEENRKIPLLFYRLRQVRLNCYQISFIRVLGCMYESSAMRGQRGLGRLGMTICTCPTSQRQIHTGFIVIWISGIG